MDRNARKIRYVAPDVVALRKESVDRNSSGAKADSVSKVALRKESVDRNFSKETPPHKTHRSLSARRAWIEMVWKLMVYPMTYGVALRKESVDRNVAIIKKAITFYRRSPQGERG